MSFILVNILHSVQLLWWWSATVLVMVKCYSSFDGEVLLWKKTCFCGPVTIPCKSCSLQDAFVATAAHLICVCYVDTIKIKTPGNTPFKPSAVTAWRKGHPTGCGSRSLPFGHLIKIVPFFSLVVCHGSSDSLWRPSEKMCSPCVNLDPAIKMTLVSWCIFLADVAKMLQDKISLEWNDQTRSLGLGKPLILPGLNQSSLEVSENYLRYLYPPCESRFFSVITLDILCY